MQLRNDLQYKSNVLYQKLALLANLMSVKMILLTDPCE